MLCRLWLVSCLTAARENLPRVRNRMSVTYQWPSYVAFCTVLILATIATAHAQATLHLTGGLELSTTPDANPSVFLSQDLANQPAGEYMIQAFITPSGVPNSSGSWQAGQTANFTVWMQVATGTAGSLFPEAQLFLNSAQGTPMCSQIGSTALTANMVQYTFSCSPSQNITVSPADRYYLWIGAHLSSSPTSSLKFELNVGGFNDSNIGVPLSANLPTITQLSVTSGSPGTSVTISGGNFGTNTGSVTFNGAGATLSGSGWSDGSITVLVPAAATSGDVIVTTAGGTPSNGAAFTVPQPNIDSLSPSSGVPGTSVQITGSNFGTIAGTVTFSGIPANTSAWSDTSITAVVPNGLPIGGAAVVVNNQSNGFLFTVVAPTLVSIAVSPQNPTLASGAQQQFTATGMYSDGSTQVLTSTATWSSSTASVAAMSPAGLATTVGPGRAYITATSGNVSGSTILISQAPPNSLTLTPSTATMLIGNDRTLALSDQNGLPVTGAAWTVDNNTAGLTLSTDDPPVLTAQNPGTATVKATVGTLSAQSTINVITAGPDGGFPSGTAQWSVAPVPGFSQAQAQMVQGIPSGRNTPDLILIENDANGNTILRGLMADGQQLWLSAAPPATYLPDAAGGALGAAGNKLLHYDGATGTSDWQYNTPTMYTTPGTITGNGIAVRPDNMIFALETNQTAAISTKSRLLGINNGSIAIQNTLPTFYFSLHNDVDFCNDVYTGDNRPWVGPIMIAPDGSAYAEVESGTSTGGFDCAGNKLVNSTTKLALLKIDPSGNSSTQTLHIYSQSGAEWLNEANYPREVIPDGEGGVLAGWDQIKYDPITLAVTSSSARITHIDVNGNATEYALPLASWCGEGEKANPRGLYLQCFFDENGTSSFPGKNLVLGDNNTAFATNGDKLAAFDVNSGSSPWSWQPLQNHQVWPTVTTAGSGVIAKDVDQNGNVSIVRFAGSGNPTYDTWTSAVGNLTSADYFVAGSSWLGYAPAVGSQAVYSGGQPVNLSASPWQQPDGAGGNAAAPDISVTGFADAGANQTMITNVMQRVEDALPLYPGCNTWLQGTVTGAQQLQAVRQFGHYGHATIQNAAGVNIEAITAFSGVVEPDASNPGHTVPVPNLPVNAVFTVNDVSAFFNVADNQHRAFLTGPHHYPGNSERTREFVIIHETAHQISVPNFLDDFTDQRAEAANNLAVDQNCRGLIEGPRIDHLRPNTGPIGTVVTITGHNFGTAPQGTTVAGTVVFSGNAPATPTSWSDVQIVVTVPAGATTGDMILNVANKTDKQRFTVQ